MKFFIILILTSATLYACGRISLTGIHPAPSSVVDDGIIYGAGGKIIGDEDVGPWSSIALDAQENPMIAYYDATNSRLKFARWNPEKNGWEIEVIDNDGDVGLYTSLKVDTATSTPWVSYYDRTNGDLKIARKIGRTWVVDVVDAGGPGNYDVGKYNSLGFSPDGRVCVSYYDETNGDLMHACWDKASFDLDGNPKFSIEAIDALPESMGGQTGLYTSLAFSDDGREFIAYYDASNGNPVLAFNEGGEWIKSTIGKKIKDLAITFDVLTLKATINPPSTFKPDEITLYKNGEVLEYGTCYALESPDTIVIVASCYDVSANYTVDYVTSPDDDGKWIDLAISKEGSPVVAYSNFSKGTVDYSVFENNEWNIESAVRTSGTDMSIISNPAGIPFITYFDSSYMNLNIAYYEATRWVRETLDTRGITGLWNSLVLDSEGNLHISYYQLKEPGNGALRYIRWTPR